MQTLKDGPQLCFLSQTLLTGVSSLLSLAPFLQLKCVHRAAAAGLPGRNVFREEELSLWWELELPGLILNEVPSCREEKAPPLGGSL